MSDSVVDQYIAGFPPEKREALERVRRAIHAGCFGGIESLRYGMPAVRFDDGRTLYFAAWTRHLGIYPVPRFDGALEGDVSPHRRAKDTVAFGWGRPVPDELVERIARALACGTGATSDAPPPAFAVTR